VLKRPPVNTKIDALTLNESKANKRGNMMASLFSTCAKVTLFLKTYFIYKKPSSS
jgi:hypothetical protein